MSTKSNRSSGTQHNARGVNQGNTLVGPKSGLPIDEVVDGAGVRRLAVDAQVTTTIGDVQVQLDGVAPDGDSVHIVDNVSGNKMKVNADGSIDSNVEVDATDGDSIMVVGTEDSTPTGTQHTHKIGPEGDLRVKDEESIGLLTAIRDNSDTVESLLTGIENNTDDLETLVTSTNSKLDTIHSDLLDIETKQDTQTAILTEIEEDTDSIEIKLDTANTHLTNLEGYTDGIEGLLTTIRDNADQVETLLTNIDGNTDGLEVLITATNSLLTTIRDNADTVESLLTAIGNNTDGLEGLITTTNSLLTTIRDNADTVEALLTAIGSNTDGIEGLITSTNTKLDTANTHLTNIESFTDGLEALITASNALLTTIRDNADTLEALITASNVQLTAINANTDGLEGLITSTNTKLDTANTHLTNLEGFTDGLEALITLTNSYVDGLESLVGTTNSSLTTVNTHLTNVEALITLTNGYVDGLEGLITSTNSKLDTTNTHLTNIEGFVDGIEALITLTNSYVDGIEGLITSTNSKLDTANIHLTNLEGFVDGIETLITSTNTLLTSILTEIDSSHYTMNEAFSKATAIAGQLDDVTTTAATENNVSPVRITAQRALHTNLRDNSGVETGTSSNRFKVDSLASPNVVDSNNSTSILLGSGATFTGTYTDLLNYNVITIVVKSDQASASLGLKIEWSADGINVHADDTFNAGANTGDLLSFGVSARYVRVRYVNGAIAQGTFALQTILHIHAYKSSSHRVDDPIDTDDDAELVKATITGKASDGNYYNVAVDTEGRLVTSAITGFGADFTFGDITTAAITRVLVKRTAYTEQTTDAQRSIVSGNANDTAAGTGARTVKITYLTSVGAGPFTETVTLNGVTPVNTVATNICFIEQIEVLTAGSSGSNTGTLTLKAAVAGGGATIGTISPTDNQTLWAHHYVATGKVCNVTGISCGHNGTTVGSGALFTLNAKPTSIANTVEIQVSDFVRLYGQTSTFSRSYASPIKVSGPARLQMYVTPETSSSIIYRAAFDFFEP